MIDGVVLIGFGLFVMPQPKAKPQVKRMPQPKAKPQVKSMPRPPKAKPQVKRMPRPPMLPNNLLGQQPESMPPRSRSRSPRRLFSQTLASELPTGCPVQEQRPSNSNPPPDDFRGQRPAAAP